MGVSHRERTVGMRVNSNYMLLSVFAIATSQPQDEEHTSSDTEPAVTGVVLDPMRHAAK